MAAAFGLQPFFLFASIARPTYQTYYTYRTYYTYQLPLQKNLFTAAVRLSHSAQEKP